MQNGTKRPRWHLIYYILAALDLVTVSLGIYLNNKITTIYNESVEESAIWATRTQEILSLSDIAISANAPGNYVFETGNTRVEAEKLKTSVTKYYAKSESIRQELKQNLSPEYFEKINTHLGYAEAALEDMVKQTYRIFTEINNKNLVEAGKNMSAMDGHYYRIIQALTQCKYIASDLQNQFFKEQRIQVKKTEQWRVYIAIAIVLMVIGITYYGRLLAQQIRESEQAKNILETEVEEALLRTQSILDTAADGIITINNSGIVLSFNKGAEKVFGYSAEEVIGNNVKMLMPAQYKEEHDDYVARYVTTGKAHIIGTEREVTGQRKNGEMFAAELSVSDVRLQGKLTFTGTIRDITHRKKVESMKNEFVSTVSHELRTPLTAIHGVITLLNSEVTGEQSAQSKEMLQKAIQNSEKLNNIINDILDMQKIEAGKLEFNEEKVSINELITSSIDENQPYADKYKVKLEYQVLSPDKYIYADRNRLLQVMANLISNACKYSPENGAVVMAAEQTGDMIKVSVTDNGPGIPEEFHQNIFSKFRQADASDTRAKGGTGLGLSITRSIVEHHKGKIWFVTEPGKYTSFIFTVPLCRMSTENDE